MEKINKTDYTIVYKIPLSVYFESMRFKDKTTLIKAVKSDWKRIPILINNHAFDTFYEYLEYITLNFPDYLETILMLSNQCAHYYNYNVLGKILLQHNIHLSTKKNTQQTLGVSINMFPCCKQALLHNIYEAYTLNERKKVLFTIEIIITLDLIINEPVFVKLIIKKA
tara:strand:- start:11511 stop:12014 length:504 start_codon:yes stop_codon:yes gene_type:complete